MDIYIYTILYYNKINEIEGIYIETMDSLFTL